MHRMMEQEKEKAMSGTRHETQPVATIIYDNGGSMPGRYVPIDPSFQTRVTCLYSAVEKWNRRG